MSRVVTASREIDNEAFVMSFAPGIYLEEQMRGAMRDFYSYQAANPSISLGPVRVKIIVEQEVE